MEKYLVLMETRINIVKIFILPKEIHKYIVFLIKIPMANFGEQAEIKYFLFKDRNENMTE